MEVSHNGLYFPLAPKLAERVRNHEPGHARIRNHNTAVKNAMVQYLMNRNAKSSTVQVRLVF